MDIWKPVKQNGSGVIFLVSGGFRSGMDMVDSEHFALVVVKPFLDRGYTLFVVSHGAQPKFTVSEIVPDIHRAVRFIRVHAKDRGVDPDRLGITGGSSGGFLALAIGTAGKPGDQAAKDPVDRASSRVQAVACFNPACDLVNYGKIGAVSSSSIRSSLAGERSAYRRSRKKSRSRCYGSCRPWRPLPRTRLRRSSSTAMLIWRCLTNNPSGSSQNWRRIRFRIN